jgi:phosphate-selective porin OprO/OprP
MNIAPYEARFESSLLTGQPEAGGDSRQCTVDTKESVLCPIVTEGEGQMSRSLSSLALQMLSGLAIGYGLMARGFAQDSESPSSQFRSDNSAPQWLVASDSASLQNSDGPGFLLSDASGEEPNGAEGSEKQDSEDASEESGGDSFETELARLHKRIEQLESSEKKRAASDKKKKEEETKKAEGWQDMSTDKWTVKLGGHVQLDYINWANADPAIPGTEDYFEFRRLRLVADGTGYGQCDFRLQMTLEPETVGTSPAGTVVSPDVKDAYFSMNEIPGLGRFRIGNFFVPFSLEQVTNDTNNIFMERSIPTQGVFAVDREVGVALYNCTDDQSVTWATGVFFDSISEGLKERIDDNQGYRVSGRVTWLPFYDEPSNGRYLIHTGAGILHTDDQDNKVSFRARPQIKEGPRIIDSGALDADSYTTGNLEFAAVMGPVTLQSEAFLSSVDMISGGAQTTHGGYAHLSYFLTGENRIFERFGQHGAQFGRNVPTSNFFMVPGAISPGAWELKTRYSHLNLDEFNKGEYNDLTTGANWYWSDRTRVMFDWIHPVTTGATVYGETTSDLLAMRFDFSW